MLQTEKVGSQPLDVVPAGAVGLAGGLVLSAITARLLPATIPIIERYDPLLNVFAVPLLVAVSLVAAFLPARTAARVNPSVALRSD